MDSESLTLLDKVHPKLKDLIIALDEQIPGKVVQGLRDHDAQAAIFAQGRTAPGPIVTHSPAGYSWHEFGLAVDFCPLSVIDEPNWAPEDPIWIDLASRGEALGLALGAMWHNPDRPHFQLVGRFSTSPTPEVRNLYAEGGLLAVWEASGL